MIVLGVLLGCYAAVALAYWVWTGYAMWRLGSGVPYLSRFEPPRRESWPKLSVVVPACDEGDKIGPAVASLLAEGYDNLQVVLVDDRSTDETGEVIDEIAAGDDRVKAVHVAELPDGWLGKVHALHRGVAECDGELVLLTDADVHYRPGALRRAVGYFLAHELDHLAAFPKLWRTGLRLDAGIAAFIRQLMVMARPWALGDAGSGAYMGVGAFNLVRRSALEAAGGLAWLRLEVADDLGLALLMKRSGAKCAMVNAFEQLALHWYRSPDEAARGADRAYAMPCECSLRRGVQIALSVLAVELAPIALPLLLAFRPLRVVGLMGVAIVGAFVASAALFHRWSGLRMTAALAGPFVAPGGALMLLRSALAGHRRGGILWRGTFYPNQMLRGGRRVRLPNWRGASQWRGQDE